MKNRGPIKQQHRPLGLQKPAPLNRPLNRPINRPAIDARSKIISKQRSKISDARVILAKKQKHAPRIVGQNQKFMRTSEGLKTIKKTITVKPKPKKVEIVKPRKPRVEFELSDEDEDEDDEEDEDEEMVDMTMLKYPPKPLTRTVKNNYVQPPMPPLPSFSRTITTDPFDCYEPYQRPAGYNPNVTAPSIDVDTYYEKLVPPPPRKGILRNSTSSLGIKEPSAALKARLYVKPDPHQPSGIFGRDRDPDIDLSHDIPAGFRIVVSNLQTTVTQSDIHELFEDIGELIDARLVRPGVAEVVYKRLYDAEMAVETYHNRQLDGQPMKCLLVRPRSGTKATAATKLVKAKDLEVDMETLHKVLFKR